VHNQAQTQTQTPTPTQTQTQTPTQTQNISSYSTSLTSTSVVLFKALFELLAPPEKKSLVPWKLRERTPKKLTDDGPTESA
jgi:hypothetical protein